MPLDGNYDESDDRQSVASFFLFLFLLLSGLVHIVSRHLRVQFFFLDDSVPPSIFFFFFTWL